MNEHDFLRRLQHGSQQPRPSYKRSLQKRFLSAAITGTIPPVRVRSLRHRPNLSAMTTTAVIAGSLLVALGAYVGLRTFSLSHASQAVPQPQAQAPVSQPLDDTHVLGVVTTNPTPTPQEETTTEQLPLPPTPSRIPQSSADTPDTIVPTVLPTPVPSPIPAVGPTPTPAPTPTPTPTPVVGEHQDTHAFVVDVWSGHQAHHTSIGDTPSAEPLVHETIDDRSLSLTAQGELITDHSEHSEHDTAGLFIAVTCTCAASDVGSLDIHATDSLLVMYGSRLVLDASDEHGAHDYSVPVSSTDLDTGRNLDLIIHNRQSSGTTSDLSVDFSDAAPADLQ